MHVCVRYIRMISVLMLSFKAVTFDNFEDSKLLSKFEVNFETSKNILYTNDEFIQGTLKIL